MQNTVLNRLNIEALSIGYQNQNPVFSDIDLHLSGNKFVAVLGLNGIGKSTFLKTIAKLIRPLAGSVKINEKDITSYSAHEISKLISIVLTEKINFGNFTVRETVSLGRYPFTNWLGLLSAEDRTLVEHAMKAVEISHLANKNVNEISDGEKQKTLVARALAQDTPIIILDEPTAFLDVKNRMELMKKLQTLCKNSGKMIITSTHDLHLAIKFSDKLIIFGENNSLYYGTAQELSKKGTISRVFGIEV